MSIGHSNEVSGCCASAPDHARLVIFVGGFDPRGARHYHQMMRSESQKQAAVSDKGEYVIGNRDKWPSGREEKPIHSLWSIRQQDAGENTATEFLFFDWHDQVRANWPGGRAVVFRQALGTYAAIWRLRQWLKPIHEQARFTLWALAYPIVYVALVFMLGAGLGMALGCVLASGVWAAAVALSVWALVCWGGFVLDGHIHVSWLLRILNFAHLSSRQAFPVLEARMGALAAEVAQGVRENRWREVVVVGFSVGTVQAVKLVSVLKQQMAIDQDRAAPSMLVSPPLVSLVTLGNCIPLFGLFPGAAALRRTLQELAQDKSVYWADISSPSDSVCFGMCDVVGLSLREDGLLETKAAKPALKTAPKIEQWGVNPQAVCSPRFHKLFNAASYRWLRRNKMRMHFQYLMAGEIAGAYDYFELLSSPGLMRDYIQKKLVR